LLGSAIRGRVDESAIGQIIAETQETSRPCSTYCTKFPRRSSPAASA
jgi:hypothetical protein